MLRLQMESQPLRYEMIVQSPKLLLETQQAQLQIETEPATVEISGAKGSLTIDHTPWRYSLGIKNNFDFVKDAATAGRQSAMNAIARLAQDGQRMAAIENGGNAISEMAKDTLLPPLANLTMTSLEPPDINYDLQPVQYNPQPGKVRYNVIPGSVINTTQPGSVDMQITQYPSLRMWTTGSLDVQA